MAEVRDRTGTNGLTAVSTFAGSGGSSTGHRLAGFRMAWANEFVGPAADTYEANKAPYTIVNRSDIRTITPETILNATGLDVGELDLFDGSPPCSAFSTAGSKDKGWGVAKSYSTGKTQVVDDLFFEYVRLIDGVQPRAFVAENVTGLVKGTAKGYFKLILRALSDCGYQVKAYVVDASLTGVPQARERLFFVGARNDLGIVPTPPVPDRKRTSMRSEFPYIAYSGAGKVGADPAVPFSNGFRPANRPIGTIGAGLSVPSGHSPSGCLITDGRRDPHRDAIDPETGASIDVGNGKCMTGWKSRSRTIPLPPDPIYRRATLAELRVLSGFPTDFALTGTYAQRWERLGRAVPPLMMSRVSSHVRDTILSTPSTRTVIV